MAFQGLLIWAAALIWIGAIFDFIDGFSARWLKQYSDIGKQLDSLADIVTFGVLPSSILFVYLQAETEFLLLPYTAYLITIFSALRLAKFNVDERQAREFLGLPTPASAIFVSALPFVEYQHPSIFFIAAQGWVLLTIIALLCFLMVSSLPMLSLKFEGAGWNYNKPRFFLIITSVVFLMTFQTFGIPLIIVLYVFLSFVKWIARKTEFNNSQPADN